MISIKSSWYNSIETQTYTEESKNVNSAYIIQQRSGGNFKMNQFHWKGLSLCRGVKKSKYGLATFMLTVFFLIIFIALINHIIFDWKYSDTVNLYDDFISEWDAEDPRLIDHIRKHYLYPPVSHNIPYHLDNPDRRYWSTNKKQSEIVESIFKGKQNGFFIECGAFDGETYSNTLSLEKYFNWTGVLIEPDYLNMQNLLTKGRKSWIVNGCLAGSQRPEKMAFYGASYVGSLEGHMRLPRRLLTRLWQPMKYQMVWCFPLTSILKALNKTKIDYFSLDVEGAETAVLNGMDWSKITVDVIQVEYTLFQGAYFDKDLSTRRKKEIISIISKYLPNHKLITNVYLDLIFADKKLVTANKQ